MELYYKNPAKMLAGGIALGMDEWERLFTELWIMKCYS